MKRYLPTILLGSAVVLTATAVLAIARTGDAANSDAVRLKESQVLWQKARDACKGNYSYQVSFGSWTGEGHITTITVKGNKVVARKYEEFDGPLGRPGAPKLKWVESESNLGSHKEGDPAVTVDALYAEAQRIVALKVPRNHERVLELDQRGLLRSCYLSDTLVADGPSRTGVAPFQLLLPPQ
jgi:hypothetical protein